MRSFELEVEAYSDPFGFPMPTRMVTHLRKNMVSEDLIKLWIGHAQQTVTDEYSKLKHDVQFSQTCC